MPCQDIEHLNQQNTLFIQTDAGILEMAVIRNGQRQKILKLELPSHQDRWYFIVYLGAKTAVDMLPISNDRLLEVFDESLPVPATGSPGVERRLNGLG